MVTQDEREFWSLVQPRSNSDHSIQSDWEDEPGELGGPGLAPTLPAEMIPSGLRAWLEDIARRACFPLELVAAPAVVAAGGVLGRSVGIMPGRFDDFIVVPNLWGAIIARPGLMKSHALAEALRPLHRLIANAHERHKEALLAQGSRRVRLQAELEGIKSLMVQSAKKGGEDSGDLERRYAAIQREIEASVVVERRYLTHDATVESFDRLLAENPRGLLVVRDELAGWLMTLTKPGREGDREFFLEAWNGTGSFTRDLIGRGTVHIEAVTLSILGGIQPAKLRHFIEEALSGRRNDDGLLQRLQVLVWPEDPGPWAPPDSRPPSDLRDRASAAFARLDEMGDLLKAAARVGQVAEMSEGGFPYLRFDPEAQEMFDHWRFGLENRLRSKQLAASPAFEAHIAKYRSLMPSLALIFHLLDLAEGQVPGPVSLEATSLGADWCGFLEDHARKVYAQELSPGSEGAQVLATKIRQGAVLDGVTVRDIARHGWAGLTSAEAVRSSLQTLQDAGWVRIVQQETGGRPTEVLRIHPVFQGGRNA